MHKFWVVMSQVYKKNARSGSWIFLVLSPLFFLAIAFGIVFYISKTQAPAQVAVVSDVSVVRQALSKQSTDDLQFIMLLAITVRQLRPQRWWQR